MPLITRRSSTRGFPPPSVGSSGSIFAHCSSVRQNRLRLTVPSHMVGGQRIAVKLIRQQDYWVFTLIGPSTKDLVAGVTLAAYAIPVSLAYATLAGLPAQVG